MNHHGSTMNPHQLPVIRMMIGDEIIQTVDARRLHEHMEVRTRFAAWISERIEQYGFAQGTDFEVFPEIGKNPNGGRPTKEYAVSLDMAKELCMVERNDKGRAARRYFIACEKQARAAAQAGLLTREDVLALIQANTAETAAKAEEYRTARVFEDGVAVAELVDGFNLPKGASRQSVAQQLYGRLRTYSSLHGLPSFKRRKVWLFARIASSELAQSWQAEMIERAKLNKARRDARDARDESQPEFPGVRLHSVRTDKPAKPAGAA
jgi:phage anti-repressor protein